MLLIVIILVILIFMTSTNLANNFQTGPGLIILVRQGTTEPVGYSQHWNWKEDFISRYGLGWVWIWIDVNGYYDDPKDDHLALLDIWRAWVEALSWHDTRISPRLELQLAEILNVFGIVKIVRRQDDPNYGWLKTSKIKPEWQEPRCLCRCTLEICCRKQTPVMSFWFL